MSQRRYPRPPGPWRPQGAPYYLETQGYRLSLPTLWVEHPRVKDNRQLVRISGQLAQLCTSYYAAPRYGEVRQFTDSQIAAAKAILAQCEPEVAKTHAIAAASAEMVDEGYAAFGFEPPTRSFAVTIASESAAQSMEVASLRAEIGRLTAENAALTQKVEQLATPAAPDSPPSPPKPAPNRPHHSKG